MTAGQLDGAAVHAILEGAGDGVILLAEGSDTRLRVEYASTSAADWLGVAPAELMGKRLTGLTLVPQGVAVTTALETTVLAAGSVCTVALDKRQSNRQMIVRAAPGIPGAFVLTFLSAVDRTPLESAAAEARLRESEERFRGAFEFAAIGMALVAPDGRWLRVNSSVCRIVGYTAEELLATNFQAITHPDDLETDIGYLAQMLDGSLSNYNMEKRYIHKDGHIIWILLSVSLVRDATGRALYFVSQIQDITERRESYRRIRELAQRLETVREEERCSIARELHEGIAQDLFAMKLNLDHLRGQASGRAGVTRTCQELAEMVDRCMLDTRHIANELRPSALAHLPVSVALKQHAQYFGNISGLAIRVIETAPIPVLEEAIALVLFRAAQEALTNVARHAHANTVEIILRSDADSITMDIIDDGIGIDEDASAKAGSLGLLGIRERINAFGGLLIVRKNAGAGTTISVRVPRIQGPAIRRR